MPSCVLKSCKNNIKKSNKSHGITYHQFPSLESRRLEWIEVIRLERNEPGWNPTRHTRICSAHFRDEDKYNAAGNRTFICKSAVPVVYELKVFENLQEHFQSTKSKVNKNIKREKSSSPVELDFTTKTALEGRIQQLLIQKSTLLKTCKSLKESCFRLQRKLLFMKMRSTTKVMKDNFGRRVLGKKVMGWMDSEIFGI